MGLEGTYVKCVGEKNTSGTDNVEPGVDIANKSSGSPKIHNDQLLRLRNTGILWWRPSGAVDSHSFFEDPDPALLLKSDSDPV